MARQPAWINQEPASLRGERGRLFLHSNGGRELDPLVSWTQQPRPFFKDCQEAVLIQIKNNKISRWSEVKKLAKLPSLKSVELMGNPIETEDPANYRNTVLHVLPQVESIY